MRVLDRGPISLAELDRYDDPDIEAGLEQSGRPVASAVFQLIEVEIRELEETARFPLAWKPSHKLDALSRGERMPPIVVVETDRGRGFGIIDGLNRTYAHWLADVPTIRAYELLPGGHR